MKTKTILAALLLAAATVLGGCADDSSAAGDDGNQSAQDLSRGAQLSDDQLKGKLNGILAGVDYMSESDYGYKVIEGDTVPAGTRLSSKVIREKLAAAVLANTDDHRDIKPTACRSQRLSVSSAIAEGESAEVPTDHNADDYITAHHDKQLMIALKTMRSQLKNVVAYNFGTNADGDEDDLGTVVFVYVGVSKTSGKLIALITQAVWT